MTELIGVAKDSAPSTIQPGDMRLKHGDHDAGQKDMPFPSASTTPLCWIRQQHLERVPTIIKITQTLPSKVVSNKPARAFSDNKSRDARAQHDGDQPTQLTRELKVCALIA